jgi:hypothetical protein
LPSTRATWLLRRSRRFNELQRRDLRFGDLALGEGICNDAQLQELQHTLSKGICFSAGHLSKKAFSWDVSKPSSGITGRKCHRRKSIEAIRRGAVEALVWFLSGGKLLKQQFFVKYISHLLRT